MKQRTIKELLILLREYIVKQDYFSGMCSEINEMYCVDLISHNEYKKLFSHLKKNRPKGLNMLDLWWDIGYKQPRLDWIDEQLKNL